MKFDVSCTYVKPKKKWYNFLFRKTRKIKGLKETDFILTNESGNPVIINSCREIIPGVYDIEFDNQCEIISSCKIIEI